MTNEEAMRLGAHCHQCPLRGEILVPPQIHPSPRFVIVGEGPGRVEEKTGAPFQGQSGKMLDAALEKNGLRRRDAYVTNAALCRGEKDKDNEKAAACCAPRLLRELEPISAEVPFLTLGKTAATSVLGVKKINLARGFVWRAKEIDPAAVKTAFKNSMKAKETVRGVKELRAETLAGRAKLAGRVVLPTLHPAFILRSDTWAPVFYIDVERFARVVRGEVLADGKEDEGKYLLSEERALGPLLRKLGPVVSCDIETDGVKPLQTKLLCVGVSDGKQTVVIWPWKHKHASVLSKWLASRKKVVFHNGFQFDLIVLATHGVKW